MESLEDPDPGSWLLLLQGGGSLTFEFIALCSSLAIVVWAVLAEAALRNARWSRLEKLVKDEKRLRAVECAFKDEDELLDTLLVIRVIASMVAILLILHLRHPGALGSGDGGLGGLVLDLGLLLLIFLVGVNGIVRGVVRAAPERALMLVLGTLRGADRFCLPVRWLIGAFQTLFSRLMGIRSPMEEEEAREEILDAVSEGEREGAIDDDEREMIESIIEFRDKAVSEIMTPRTSVFGLSVDTPVSEAVRSISEKGHSRVPVYRESLDNVLGILYAKDLLTLWDLREEQLPGLEKLLRKPLYVPETKSLSELLKELRRSKIHLAVVLDEYGGMSGLVTIEDILEEIVGEIEDEFDRSENSRDHDFARINDHEAEVSGRMDVEELNEVLGIDLPNEDSYETLGGFLFTQLGRVPDVGETTEFDNVKFEVLDADDRRIKRVRVVVCQ